LQAFDIEQGLIDLFQTWIMFVISKPLQDMKHNMKSGLTSCQDLLLLTMIINLQQQQLASCVNPLRSVLSGAKTVAQWPICVELVQLKSMKWLYCTAHMNGR
jgi:hypothetical protein